MTDVDVQVEAKANERYWNSDESVNGIAEDLELSKGSLYSIILPLPTALGCPECGEELLYPNRTAREQGIMGCPSCGFEGEEGEADPLRDDGGAAAPMGGAPADAGEGLLDLTQKRTLIGGALLGAAAGLALVFWSRRR